MGHKSLGWGVTAIWGVFSAYYLTHTDSKLSLYELMIMMPQWCELSEEFNTSYTVLTPQATIIFCMGVTVMLTMCWYSIQEDDIDVMTSEASEIDQYVKTDLAPEDNLKEDALLESAKSLMDLVDLEYQHCAATIASNNETPGKKVGGEAEWATGETSSEDEDATREITGAQIRNYPKDTEEEQILKFLDQ
ncbi:hypothetical protein J6590_003115 [Homalodisca vitripennis]|nr:hypothetical protein J6590_104496 [Homalodisca vitripennis]KAG8299140.1 hypothetical protein J6590_003115 [Homalodisca vitripennis]